jgi:glycogen synthase
MKLFAALGPGDIAAAARAALAGRTVATTSIAFSEQLFAYCRVRAMETLAISSNARADYIKDGSIFIENRPKSSNPARNGLLFHFLEFKYALYLAFRAWRFGADLAIIDSGTTHFFALAGFRVLGIPVVINLHNVLWPVGFPPRRRVEKLVRVLNAFFFQHLAAAAMGVSPECERQVLLEARDRISFFQYRTQFVKKGFTQSSPYEGGAFNVAFVGRAETNKGTLDIASISECLSKKTSIPVVFHVCGNGPALPALQEVVQKKELQDKILIHGHLERSDLLKIYSICHAVIVPTRSTFREGFPQVCAEAMIASLPVITSKVANAFDVIGSATIEARTDDIESYADAICRMVTGMPSTVASVF